ncbi:hypothetical protein JCM1840_005671 [Sporobolomyces johnsonii]
MPRSSRRRAASASPSESSLSDSDLSSFLSSSESEEKRPARRSSARSSTHPPRKKGALYRSLPQGSQQASQTRNAPDQAPEKQSTPSTAPRTQNPAEQDGTSRHNRKVCLIVTVVIVALLLALGGVGVWYSRDKLFSSDTSDASTSSTPPASGKAASSATNASLTALITSTVPVLGTSTVGHSNSAATASASDSGSTSTALAISSSQSYNLSRECSGSGFFDCFSFDSDKGISKSTATSNGLVSVTNTSAFLRLNSWTDIDGDQVRPYMFMEMATTYRYGLLIVDVPKIPWGCGAWSSIFSNTLEGISLMTQSTPTVIASDDGCKIGSSSIMTGTPLEGHTDCSNSSFVDGYSGCSVQNPSTSSYGEAWNNANGGVFATLLDETDLYMWQFPRAAVPSTIDQPNPSQWGLPLAAWPASSCSTNYFSEQTVAITLGVCGVRPEANWTGYCAAAAADCAEYVQTGSNIANAVWEFNYLRLYSISSNSSSDAATASDDSTSSVAPTEAAPLKRTVKRKRAAATKAAVPAAEEALKDRYADLTALLTAVRKDMDRYPDALVLTQVGMFFEAYFEHAAVVASALGFRLTSKEFGARDSKKSQPMSGFPVADLLKHVSTLVEAGHKVVIVEEFKEAGSVGGATKRKVTRVVTPGTGVDESFVQMEKMNFVLGLGVAEGTTAGEIGMAYRDISTGASFTRVSTLSSLRDDIHLVQPKEVVVDERLKATELGERVLALLKGEQQRESLMVSSVSTSAVPSLSGSPPSPQSAAESVLLAYLANTLVSMPIPKSSTTFVDPASVVQMDSVTLKSLEIRESLRGGIKGSLLQTVKRTMTPGGTRLLTERLCAPSTDLRTIQTRLNLVSAFHDSLPESRLYLRPILRSLDDTPRLLQRLYLRRGSAFDLLGLKRTMRALDTIRTEIDARVPTLEEVQAVEYDEGHTEEIVAIRHLVEKLGDYTTLPDEIEAAIDEEAVMRQQKEAERKAALKGELGERAVEREEEEAARKGGGEEELWGDKPHPWIIKPSFSSALSDLHTELVQLRRSAFQLQEELRTTYASKGLTLRYVLKVGPAVHVHQNHGYAKIEADSNALQYQKSGSTRVYVLKKWVDLYNKITAVSTKIQELESETMDILRTRVLDNYDNLLQTADALAELDVAMSFAELAQEKRWNKPIVDESKSLDIVEGRHPTVENALLVQNRQFTANSVAFRHPDDAGSDPSLIHVLTGPNMAGKSTFIRQTALIIILAQAGSFVPAQSARVGIFDKVYSRVGARDELDRDRSTFMIEMDEATSILEGATSRSLVLLDELGRGTSPIDGLAIAYAALEHLTHVNRSRTLFATHYHRLGDLLGYDENDPRGKGEWEGIEFWCTNVEEADDSVRYIHEVRRGLNSDSAGLIIARLAGMPVRAIQVATDLKQRFLAGEV